MFKSEEIAPGVRLHFLPTDKYKTVTYRVYVQTALGQAPAFTALLPMVLSRGSSRFPTMQAIAVQLAELYGARFGCDVAKIGERHCMDFYFEMVSPAYVRDGSELLYQGMATLLDLLLNPRKGANGFCSEYVEQEKANLENRIKGLIDDKRSYAQQRFLENMFQGEPFATYKYGTSDEVKTATPESLWQHYEAVIAQSPIDVFIVGEVDSAAIATSWERAIAEVRNGYSGLPPVHMQISQKEVRQVRETGDLQQGILFMGYRTPVTYSSADYHKLLVYTGVLGGFPHSKLFTNVRERASLAYYVWSRVDATKGFLVINAGINPEDYDEAVQIITEQVDELNRGAVTSLELEKTKRGLVSAFLTMQDNAMAVVDRGMMELVNETERDIPATLDGIEAITIEDLVEQGAALKLDTIYFLEGQPIT